jgi:hypothetical protein
MSQKESRKVVEALEKEQENELNNNEQAAEFSTLSQDMEQDMIKILNKIDGNQKKLVKASLDFYSTYLSTISDIMQKGFIGTYEKSLSGLGNSIPSKKFEGQIAKIYEDLQANFINSVRLNNNLILNMLDLAMANNRLYSSAFVNDFMFNLFSPPKTG